MAKKQKEEVKLVPTYGYHKNEDGFIDLITIYFDPVNETVEIERETQSYKDDYRAVYDLQAKITKKYVTKGSKK